MLGYCRVSTGEQAERKHPIDLQRARLIEYAELRGFDLELYVDEGVSGRRSLANRPAGAELLAELRGGVQAAVIATSLDRLWRNTADALQQVEKWRPAGIVLHLLDTHHGSVETGTAGGWFMFSTMAGVGEFEARRTGERTRAGLAALKAKGVPLGAPPYGWRREGTGDTARLVPDEAEQAGLTLMRELRADGLAFHAIAAELRRRGIKTKRGGEWFPATVRGILARKAPDEDL